MNDERLPQDHQDLAAELALGLLEGEERAEALRLHLADPAFAAEVEAWRDRLSPLLDTIPAQSPPAWLWNAIDARVGKGDAATASRSARMWRRSAIASGALAACLALFAVLRPPVVQSPYPFAVSQLADVQGKATMAVRYDPATATLRLEPKGLGNGQKSPELWIIPDDGVPRSLGIVGGQRNDLTINPDLRPFFKTGAILAITLEDPATAPHKAPTATPILTGKISLI